MRSSHSGFYRRHLVPQCRAVTGSKASSGAYNLCPPHAPNTRSAPASGIFKLERAPSLW